MPWYNRKRNRAIPYACADTSNHIRGKQCPVHPNYGVPQAQKVAKGYSTLRHLKRATIY